MNDLKKRRIATVGGDGVIRLEEQDLPVAVEGTVLVEVHASLVSPGSELGGWRGLSRRRRGPTATCAATALHALRRNVPEFGEYTEAVGLDLVGQPLKGDRLSAGNRGPSGPAPAAPSARR